MIVTEVRIKLVDGDPEEDRLQAFVSITFDNAFVIRDLKLIEGTKGLFLAMPSRKLTDRCPKCGGKNHLRARFCNQCGYRLDEERATRETEGRAKLHADIAHPINSAAREDIEKVVTEAYREERRLAHLPGYVCRYDDPDHMGGSTGAANQQHDGGIEVSPDLRATTDSTDRGAILRTFVSEGTQQPKRPSLVWSSSSRPPHVHKARRYSKRL